MLYILNNNLYQKRKEPPCIRFIPIRV